MPSAKQLLLQQTADAFAGRPDMSLMASLAGITADEAAWQPDDATPSIEQLVRHLAWAKSRFCADGFGRAMPIDDPSVAGDGDSPDLPNEFPCGAGWGRAAAVGIGGAVELLQQAQAIIMSSLESCTDESLDRPIPTRHGKTAAHFFSVMLMHDLYHAGQIRTRRTMYNLTRHSPRGHAS
jgi:hypothetical protein